MANTCPYHLNGLRYVESAAHLVYQARFCEHVTYLLKEHHWLHVKARVEYEICPDSGRGNTQVVLSSILLERFGLTVSVALSTTKQSVVQTGIPVVSALTYKRRTLKRFSFIRIVSLLVFSFGFFSYFYVFSVKFCK